MSNVVKATFGEQRTCERLQAEFAAEIRRRSNLADQTAQRLAVGIVASCVRLRDAGTWTIGTQAYKPGQDPAQWIASELQRYAAHMGNICYQELFRNFWAALEARE